MGFWGGWQREATVTAGVLEDRVNIEQSSARRSKKNKAGTRVLT